MKTFKELRNDFSEHRELRKLLRDDTYRLY